MNRKYTILFKRSTFSVEELRARLELAKLRGAQRTPDKRAPLAKLHFSCVLFPFQRGSDTADSGTDLCLSNAILP